VRTNAVSRKHAEVTRDMFPGRDIEYVTNGIYHPRWVGQDIRAVLDTHLPGWAQDPVKLRDVFAIPDGEIEAAMRSQKQTLIDWVNTQPRCFSHAEASADDQFDTDTLTVGFARRFVSYKRPDLIFKNIDRLRAIGHRRVQFVFAGHCHPDDAFCNRLHDAIAHHDCELRGQIRTVVASDYNLDIATRMVQGVDIWLNNPVSPREASGTSGMKAALNGALNLSILDGWWIEGYEMQPKSGWGVVGSSGEGEEHDMHDNAALLDALEEAIKDYHDQRSEWMARVKAAIALVGHFNTHRMVREYQEKMWL
ncbi:alpha-glucan family phosphorylase, partial [Candidatus Kaiserbacteria bacterium]|nr:alpha-glucan family phosphorylase [Candidatus Kaiserbacteria bacterium]